MRTVKYPGHIADVMIYVEADTVEELFSGALEGMNHILTGGKELPRSTGLEKFIEITPFDSTSLLIDFLSEVLSFSCENKVVYSDLLRFEMSDTNLKVRLAGTPVDTFDEEIKGVSYHMAEIGASASGKLSSYVVFDL